MDTKINVEAALNANKRQTIMNAPAPVMCEACGYIVPSRDEAINIIINVGSPGHPSLAPFQCPGGGDTYGDHWACSIECLKNIAHDCIENHVQEVLLYLHKNVGIDRVQKRG